jgi:integrase
MRRKAQKDLPLMAVRRRTWTNGDGSESGAWVASYTDQARKRRIKSFARQRDALAFHASVALDLRAGVHVPDSQSVTVAEAGKLWLRSCEAVGLERSTWDQYRQHLEFHILPFLGAAKLSRLTAPMVRAFEDKLALDRSAAMVRKARSSLGAILADAQERGLVGQNVVRALRARRRGQQNRADKRHKGKLKIGVDLPSPDEVRTFIVALDGHWRPLLLTAIFTGLRGSELRGLRWADVDLKRGELSVRQRADRYDAIGRPKSEAGERIVPLPPIVVTTLRAHRLAQQIGPLDLVFANGVGKVESHANIYNRGLVPAQIAAGVVDEAGKAKYSLHALRHFYASWCINRRVDGGLELPLKLVQARLGHASITMTADCYGHLFPRLDDGAELAAAEKAFLGG